jgi:hypothetical protein
MGFTPCNTSRRDKINRNGWVGYYWKDELYALELGVGGIKQIGNVRCDIIGRAGFTPL